jgi:hypothetical protein
VELQFFAKTEFGRLDAVDDATAKIFEHFVSDGQGFQLVVDQ